MPLPPFHAFAFLTQFIYPIFASISAALYPPVVTKPDALPITPTPNNILPQVQATKSNCIMVVPAMLQIWAQDEEDVKVLKGLKAVVSLHLLLALTRLLLNDTCSQDFRWGTSISLDWRLSRFTGGPFAFVVRWNGIRYRS